MGRCTCLSAEKDQVELATTFIYYFVNDLRLSTDFFDDKSSRDIIRAEVIINFLKILFTPIFLLRTVHADVQGRDLL